MPTQAEAIEAVLNRLRANLGLGESPAGSNHNFITEWYNANVDRIGNGAWCEMTNTWAMWTGGAKNLKRGRAYTVWAAQDGQNGTNGSSWHYGVSGMKAGDQVYYDWNGVKGDVNVIDHTGTVEKVNGDGTFYALEGNISDKLQRMHRDSKYVVGYVRFDWPRISTTSPTEGTKTVAQVAAEVLLGKWGNGEDRVTRLRAAGYNPDVVQDEVNRQYSGGTPSTPKKSIAEIAAEVLQGKWGNGADRVGRLNDAGYDPKAVQDEVNRQYKSTSSGKTVTQLAKEVIQGKWGNGDDRVAALKKAGYDPQAVQREVNRQVG